MKFLAIILVNITVTVISATLIISIFQLKIKKRMLKTTLEHKKEVEKNKEKSEHIKNQSHKEANALIQKTKRNLDEEIKSRRNSISQIEERILKKEAHLEEKESNLEENIERIKELKKKEEELIQSLSEKLEKIAGLSKEEAEKLLMSNIERKVKTKAGELIKRIEDESKKIANRRAKEIITTAMQRTAVDVLTTQTTTIVELPNDELKGRVIGKEGRNIRAIESCAGVDVIIDETPNSVIISCFDPIRRQVAKLALQKLIEDGRIHPARIEETVEAAREELQQFTTEKGEKALESIGVKLHPKITEILGRLYYRYSYGQNMLHHAVECAQIAALIAEELGVDVNLAKRGALLHDIGKGLDFEIGGSHDEIGKNLCQKYGESDEILNCIMAHHEQEEPNTIEAIIVIIADTISSARPGARRESVENYIKRLTKLESIAKSYDSVEKAYAIQAGREIRIFVKPDQISDVETKKLSFDIAEKIEKNVDFPGQIKVSVIRETRTSSIAG
ncbi:MAG: ribonuclease Y [bacterium]